MGEKWFDFVKRIHQEGQKKDKDYSFKKAMMDASKRKSEWKKDGSSSDSKKSSSRKTKKGGKRRRSGTKKNRKSRSRK